MHPSARPPSLCSNPFPNTLTHTHTYPFAAGLFAAVLALLLLYEIRRLYNFCVAAVVEVRQRRRRTIHSDNVYSKRGADLTVHATTAAGAAATAVPMKDNEGQQRPDSFCLPLPQLLPSISVARFQGAESMHSHLTQLRPPPSPSSPEADAHSLPQHNWSPRARPAEEGGAGDSSLPSRGRRTRWPSTLPGGARLSAVPGGTRE